VDRSLEGIDEIGDRRIGSVRKPRRSSEDRRIERDAVNLMRKTLGALFAVLGTYYCLLSVLTLAALPDVTTRWVQRSGESWLALAIAAPLLHWAWFVYRTIGNGVLDRGAQAIAMRNNGAWFASICLAYLAMWFMTRDGDSVKVVA